MSSFALQNLIEEYAPHRPWCGIDKNAAKVRPLSTALTLPYMQMSNPALACWLIFDIDRPGAATAWTDADLPPPTYVATNPENGHAHLGYALAAPVCVTDAARKHPQRYLAAIEHAYMTRLRADAAFNGPLAKNPLNERWKLWEPANCPTYELGLLADYVDLPTSLPRRPKPEGYSRNCDLFEVLLAWGVRAIRGYWAPGGENRWREACIQQALALNTFTVPLGMSEVMSIGRSVSRWTWKNTTPAGFRAVQAERGQRGGIASVAARRAATEEQRSAAIVLARQGLSNRAIAAQLGVSHPTIAAWLHAGGE
ncbi:TPA: replication initiation protein [Burkholderia vietnamiensis]|uniref:Replication initiation protein n=1 Tax=Burkholderia vietnamiensis TaxID=60552 RepID=A0AAW7T079_BURVI|nr:replication initiation protein [Burkholderia vietnamiensis]MDN7795484.1 replication initiation protein [Burkholderia vietnamiensis]HDR8920146.1 replication initiation protein [Burkholderia vietnamiensis]HDR8940679.1 replication initiation protein [Burkholderia vietnamiensis]HDR8977918.1 replication initiation protein [Burkholderia vietnamiensis]HDR9051042.1 replication initiation protein [Burkholderia vietnamiensis]